MVKLKTQASYDDNGANLIQGMNILSGNDSPLLKIVKDQGQKLDKTIN